MTRHEMAETLRSGDFLEITLKSGAKALMSNTHIGDGYGSVKAEFITAHTDADFDELAKTIESIMRAVGMIAGKPSRFNSMEERDRLHRQILGGGFG